MIFQEHRSFSAVAKFTSFPWQEPCRAAVCSCPSCQPRSRAPRSSGVQAQCPALGMPAVPEHTMAVPGRALELLVVPCAPQPSRYHRRCQPGAWECSQLPHVDLRQRLQGGRWCEQKAVLGKSGFTHSSSAVAIGSELPGGIQH